MPELQPNEPSDIIEIDLRDVWHKIIKHRQTIITAVGVCVVFALVAAFTATPIFIASSRILVEPKPPKIVKIEGAILPDYTDRTSFFNSQVEVLKSHTVAELVFKDLGHYEMWGRRGQAVDKLKPVTGNQRVDFLLKHVKITPVRMTQVIEVSAEDPDSVMAARIANGWARAYVLFSSQDQLLQRRSELESDMVQQLKFLKDKHPVIIGLKNEIDAIDEKINNERNRLSKDEGSSALMSDITNVKILDRAEPPTVPARPRKALNVVLALVLGLFAGVGLVFLFESLDQTIKTPDDMQALLKLLCLVPIPRYESDATRPDASPEFVADKARHSTMAEAFRSLRTGIIFSNPDLPKKTFLITSSSPSEGKTTVAVNMATVFAQAEERVILIDTDLRNPRLHSVFKIDRANGVTDILAFDKADIAAFIHPTNIKGLDFLACGEVPPNPSELLGSKKMKDLIVKLSAIYDRIIFDTPPVLAATDAVVLSTQVDATIIVVKAGSTHRQAAIRSVEALRSVHANVLGAVFNMITNSDQNPYYYYYYHYGHNADKKVAGRSKANDFLARIDPRNKKT